MQVMRFESVIQEVIYRASDVKSFRFPRPVDFTYKAGQFIFVTVRHGENKLSKPLSISSSPSEKDYIEFTKKLTGHEFSNILDAMKVGDWLEIAGPYGTFTIDGESNRLCMLSGGVGITPLRSICKYCTDMRSDVDIILIFGSRIEKNIIFREDLEQMEMQNRNLRVILTLDEPSEGWRGETGVINTDMIKRNVPDYSERTFFICGPPGMVQAITNLLKNLNLPTNQIKIENFAGY
ncbi:MAG: glycine betaine catabolism [Thermoproteota archaeon]|nr:glycine betaine catabolism [Thermoproteota archaeon]